MGAIVGVGRGVPVAVGRLVGSGVLVGNGVLVGRGVSVGGGVEVDLRVGGGFFGGKEGGVGEDVGLGMMLDGT